MMPADYVRLLKYGDSLYRCKELKRAALVSACTAPDTSQGSFSSCWSLWRLGCTQLDCLSKTPRGCLSNFKKLLECYTVGTDREAGERRGAQFDAL